MDWLRSEDLKEEKNVTAPVLSITVAGTWHALFLRRLQTSNFPVEVLRAGSLRVALIFIFIFLVLAFVVLFLLFFVWLFSK